MRADQLDHAALDEAKRCLADAMAWGCEPQDALGSAIVQYLAALASQEPVAWPRGTRIRVEHDGFEGVVLDPYTTLEGKRGQVCQLAGAKVVHVYGEKWLIRTGAEPVAAKAEAEGWRPTHRHLKSGHLVRVIGIGKMQSAAWADAGQYHPVGAVTVDMREVVIYEHGGALWARPREEFEDGRFEPLHTGKGDGQP